MPVDNNGDASFAGLHWGVAKQGKGSKPQHIEWWRNDAGLLANTRNGTALPLADVEVNQHFEIVGEGVPLARLDSHDTLLMRSSEVQGGHVWFLGTSPGPGVSSLAQDGVALYVMLHRALNEGARTLGKAQQRAAARDVLGDDQALSKWHRASGDAKAAPVASYDLPLRAGVVESGEKLVALNRPASEDNPTVLGFTALDELFAGLDYRRLEDTVENSKSLTSEVWRTFLILMAIFLVGEAILSMPQKREPVLEVPVIRPQVKEEKEKGKREGVAV